MELKHLRAFLAIVETGSFRGAAKELGISQPSLSQQIGKLEDSFGELLFERFADGVTLTESGTTLSERACEILSLVEDTHRAIRERIDSNPGIVNVGVLPTLTPFVVPEAARRLRSTHEDARVNIIEATTPEILSLVGKGSIDFGIIATEEHQDPRCVCEHVCDEPLLLMMAAGSAWEHRERLCAEDIDKAGIIVLDDMHCLSTQVTEFCARENVKRVIRLGSGQISTVVELVRCDLGITMIPVLAAESQNMTGLATRPVVGVSPTRPIHLLWRRKAMRSRIASSLADIIKQHVPDAVRSASATWIDGHVTTPDPTA